MPSTPRPAQKQAESRRAKQRAQGHAPSRSTHKAPALEPAGAGGESAPIHASVDIRSPGPHQRTGRGPRPTGREARAGLGAVGYVRRSTDRQEQSIPDQQRAIERYCAQHGLRLLRYYTDDAISGTSTSGRHGFQSLIGDAQSPARDFDAIVCYDVKRFGRVGNDEAGYYRHLLRQHGVVVHYASENFAGDGTDDLLRPVKQWQAREESKDLSKVTIRGLLSKSTTGHWMGGAPPFGYDLRYQSQSGQFLLRLRYSREGTKSVLDDSGKVLRTLQRGESIAVSRRDCGTLVPGEPGRVRTVQRIFDMYVNQGRGYKAIADALNRDKVPTARSPGWASHYSGQWSLTTVRAVLVNPAYCGDMAWNRRTDARFHSIQDGQAVARTEALGRRLEANDRRDWVVVQDAHEAIVSRRVWLEAQRLLALKPESRDQRGINPRSGTPVPGRDGPVVGGWTGPRARFLLSGLCLCIRCSSRYEGHTNRGCQRKKDGQRTKWYSYACGAAIRRGPSVCRLGLVRQEVLESAVVGAVLGYYERYSGPKGLKALKAAAQGQLGEQHQKARGERVRLAQRLAKVEATIENLLDNITPANRALVDERIGQLAKERESLKLRVQEQERLGLSEHEVSRAVAETGRFLSGLRATFECVDLAERQAAIRRCVRRVWVDHERQRARVVVWGVPAGLGRAEGSTDQIDLLLEREARRCGF